MNNQYLISKPTYFEIKTWNLKPETLNYFSIRFSIRMVALMAAAV